MKKNILKTFLILGIIVGNLNADIIPAKEAKKIQQNGYIKLKQQCLKDKNYKKAYKLLISMINTNIKKISERGLYNVYHMNNITTEELRNIYKLLSSKDKKEFLKMQVKKELQQKGYKVETGQYDYPGNIDWYISW